MSAATILIVDDSRENADILRRYLEMRGYAVRIAYNADEAMAQFDSVRPGLVLLDVLMPGRDGWAVCRAMREHPHGAHARIVMLTGLGERRAREGMVLTGADDVITKPIELPELAECVRRNLGHGADAAASPESSLGR